MAFLLAVAVALVAGLVLPYFIAPALRRMGVVDEPNWRSSHSITATRGGGLAPLAAMALAFAVLFFGMSAASEPVLANLALIATTAIAMGLLGWVEDSRGLSVMMRASLQLLSGVAASAGVVIINQLPLYLVVVFGLFIAGYVNVTNFMDGINGISALHGLVVGSLYSGIGLFLDAGWLASAGAILAAAFATFFPWNVRGRLFLGDVGSYLLGGTIAATAVAALGAGVHPLAVLGPLAIYLSDSGMTLLRRVARGERWQDAHREHVYQRLASNGLSHLKTASLVTAATILSGISGVVVLAAAQLWAVSAALIVLIVSVYLLLPTIWSKTISANVSASEEGTA